MVHFQVSGIRLRVPLFTVRMSPFRRLSEAPLKPSWSIFFSLIAFLQLTQIASIAQREAKTGTTTSAPALMPNHWIEREVEAGRTDAFTVELEKGQYLHVLVRKEGVELVATITDLNGQVLITADDPPNRAFAIQPVSVIAGTTGNYQISIFEPARTSRPGKYQIELNALRQPSETDRIRVAAEESFYKAVSDDRAGDKGVIEEYEASQHLWHSIHDTDREALCLYRIGVVRLYAGDFEKAMAEFKQILPLWRVAIDRRGEANTLSAMGYICRMLGDITAAEHYLANAIELETSLHDPAGKAVALSELGALHLKTGDDKLALQDYTKMLALERSMGARQGEANALESLGLVYRDFGENKRALDNFNGALAIEIQLDNRRNEPNTFLNIAFALREIGDDPAAINNALKALDLLQQQGQKDLEARVLFELAFDYGDLHDFVHARSYDDRALALSREVGDREVEAQSLGTLAGIESRSGDCKSALEHWDQVLTILRAIRDRIEEGWVQNSIGSCDMALGAKTSALSAYLQAVQLGRATSNTSLQGAALTGLMNYWKSNGNPGLAVFFGKQAINQFQEIRNGNRGLSGELQGKYVESVENDYRALAGILITEGRLAEAEQILSLLKEHEFRDYVQRDSSDSSAPEGRATPNSIEAIAQKKLEHFSDDLVTIGVERGKLLAKTNLSSAETQRLEGLEREIARGNVQFENLMQQLEKEFAQKGKEGVRVEELRETQAIMDDLRELPEGTVAVFTVVGDKTFHAILRTPDVQKSYEYPITAEELNQKVAEFRKTLANPSLDPRPQAAAMYRVLVGPMAEDLRKAGATTLMWSLDGSLRYLPVAALYDGEHYLIENYRVSVMTLASNLHLSERPTSERRGVGFGITRAMTGSPALPWVAAELGGIIATRPGDPGVLRGKVELDDQFTLRSMRAALIERYSVVHIASHFRFQAGDDSQSYLLIGDGSHLSLADLKTSAHLFGGVQLLTLSACNTGMGDGAEVEGFGTLAQRQGAKAIVASLWSVADSSTSVLMQSFYRHWQSSPDMTKLEALREAQLELLRGDQTPSARNPARGVILEDKEDGGSAGSPFSGNANAPYAHPFYWAPFFLMGNWL